MPVAALALRIDELSPCAPNRYSVAARLGAAHGSTSGKPGTRTARSMQSVSPMTTKQSADPVTMTPPQHEHAGALALETLVAAAAGATFGILGGPPGMVIGAIAGGAIGATAGEVLYRDHLRAKDHDEELDRVIGVVGGDLGAAPPASPDPRSTRGTFHAASLGVGTTQGSISSDGPIQALDD
jgi:outer membrane lipoprotein SlyB